MENIMSSKVFATRQGTVLLGVIAAVIAAIALIVYLENYRGSSAATEPVLVANHLIPAGTPGDVIAKNKGYYTVKYISRSALEAQAIQNPQTLTGEVATTDIGFGQQLTAADFGANNGSVANSLNPTQRAVVIPLGSPQEVGGQIGAGSYVDFWVLTSAQASNGVSRPSAKLLFQNLYVLGASGGNVTLRATVEQAGKIIYASANTQVWLALRSAVGRNVTKPPVVTSSGVIGR